MPPLWTIILRYAQLCADCAVRARRRPRRRPWTALACISTYATAMPCRAVATPSSTELTHAPTTGMTSRLSEKTGSATATT